jgi:hypothetical protein
MAKQKVLFGEWLPDQPGITGAVTDAINCYPVTNGYAPFKSEANYSNNAGQTLSMVFAGKFNSSTNLFAASSSQLYKFDSSNANLNALTTSGYTATESWDVTQFGSKMIAANGVNKLQAYDMSGGTYFADLSADAPVCKYITVVRDFVVAGNDGSDDNKVYWSDINNEVNWTPSSTSQADHQILPDGGDITGMAGGEYGIIFMERAIYRMSYVGSPLFFQFDAISRTLGCISNGSLAQFGGITYFLSDDGFYACDGQNVKNIGAEKVNRWFFDNAIPSELRISMSATIDPVRKLIVWDFKNTSGGRYLLFYSIDLNRWSYAETTATSVAYGLTPSASLEQVDNYNSNLDALDIPLDSRVWAGGILLFMGVSGQKIISFSGQNKSASITSGDIDAGRSVLTFARPLIDGGSGTISVASRQLLSDDINFGTAISPDYEGRIPLRNAGRYHRVKMSPTSATWKTAVGTELVIVGQGDR